MENFDIQKLFDMAKSDAPPLTRDEATQLVNAYKASPGKVKIPKKGIILFCAVALLGLGSAAFAYFVTVNSGNENSTEKQTQLTLGSDKQNNFENNFNAQKEPGNGSAKSEIEPVSTLTNSDGNNAKQKKIASAGQRKTAAKSTGSPSEKPGRIKVHVDKAVGDVNENWQGENLEIRPLIAGNMTALAETTEVPGLIKVSVKDTPDIETALKDTIYKKTKAMPSAERSHLPLYIKADILSPLYWINNEIARDLSLRRLSFSAEKMITPNVSAGLQFSFGSSQYLWSFGGSGTVDTAVIGHYTFDHTTATIWKGLSVNVEGRYYMKRRYGRGLFAGGSLSHVSFVEQTYYRYYTNGNKVPFTIVNDTNIHLTGLSIIGGYKAVFLRRLVLEALVGWPLLVSDKNGNTGFVSEGDRRRNLARYEISIGWRF